MSDSPPPTVRPALRTFAVSAVLFAGTVLLFSRGLGYDFSIYDDPRYVTNNPHVQAGFTWGSLVWAFAGRADYWHPLTWLSHMLDWRIYGANAAGHHLTSVLWHAVNAVLAFLVLRRLTAAFWTSAASAALWAWHPLRVESVVWITERKDVMSGCFFLLMLWAYVTWAARRANARPHRGWYAGTLGLFLAGLMCKPVLVTAPLVLLLLDAWPLRRAPVEFAAWRAWRGLLLEKVPFFALSIAISVVTVLMQQDNGAFVLDLPLTARLGNAVVSLLRYLRMYFWPFGLTVCYPHPGHWPVGVVAAAALLVGALTSVAWRHRHSRPWLLVGWGWFLALLLPVLGLVQVGFQAMADRYTYMPMLGWQLALCWTVREFATRTAIRTATAVVAVAAAIGCGWRTWSQEGTWRSSVALFEHAVAVTEHNDFAHSFLGYTYLSVGRAADAIRECREALAINPRNSTAYFTLAGAQEISGEIGDAIRSYRAALALKPNDPSIEFPLGLLLLRQGEVDAARRDLLAALAHDPALRPANLEYARRAAMAGDAKHAAFHFEIAVTVAPDDPDAQFGLGVTDLQLGRPDDALRRFEATLRLRPNDVAAHIQLGWLLLARHQPADAAAHFRAALAANSKLGAAYLGLGRAEELLDDAAAAAAAYEDAVRFAPNDPEARRAWARTLARARRFEEAAAQYEQAARLRPGDASIQAELGYALWLAGRRTEAVAAWKAALRLEPGFPGLRERLEQLGIR